MKLIAILCHLHCFHFYIALVHLQVLMTLGARVPLASVMPFLAANSYLYKQQQQLQPYNGYIYTPYPIYYRQTSLRGGYYPWTTGMRRYPPIYSNNGYGSNGMYPPNGMYNGNYGNNYYPNDYYGNSQYNRGGGNNGYGTNTNGRGNTDDYGSNSYDGSNTGGTSYSPSQMNTRNKAANRG